MGLFEQSNVTIFGSLDKSKEYAKLVAFHTPDQTWCVYQRPKRSDYTVAKLDDCWAEDDFNIKSVVYVVVCRDGSIKDA